MFLSGVPWPFFPRRPHLVFISVSGVCPGGGVRDAAVGLLSSPPLRIHSAAMQSVVRLFVVFFAVNPFASSFRFRYCGVCSGVKFA